MADGNDDVHLRGYQDDTDTSDDATDPLMDEREDDPVKAFGVPAKEFKAEMDKLDLEDPDSDSEDARERIEDLDEDPEQESLAN